MSGEPLTPLQWAVLKEMSARTSSFFLSGGAALAGFHLHHRPTTDLDLFTLDGAAIVPGLGTIRAVAAALGGRAIVRQQTPGFIRVVVDVGDDAVVVDLVHDPVPQLHAEKELRDGVQVDPLDEILVNKLTALVGSASRITLPQPRRRTVAVRRRPRPGCCRAGRSHPTGGCRLP